LGEFGMWQTVDVFTRSLIQLVTFSPLLLSWLVRLQIISGDADRIRLKVPKRGKRAWQFWRCSTSGECVAVRKGS
jgi:hypothetical protein